MGTPGVPLNIPKETIEAALKLHKGKITYVARQLDIAHSTLYRIIRANPDLEQLTNELRHEHDDFLLDGSEDNLAYFLGERVNNPQQCLTTTFYVLNTKGAKRGYLPAEVAAAQIESNKGANLGLSLEEMQEFAEWRAARKAHRNAKQAETKPRQGDSDTPESSAQAQS